MTTLEIPKVDKQSESERSSRFKRTRDFLAATALASATFLGGDHAPSTEGNYNESAAPERSHSTSYSPASPNEHSSEEDDEHAGKYPEGFGKSKLKVVDTPDEIVFGKSNLRVMDYPEGFGKSNLQVVEPEAPTSNQRVVEFGKSNLKVAEPVTFGKSSLQVVTDSHTRTQSK